jgi:non-canonical purine NTP pyrophosphatase (RdgB/HAM1 family)
MLKFITGNKTKFKEVQAVFAPIKIKQVDINLLEIQELNPRKIIEHKLREAFKHRRGEFIIDDSSLYLKCFDYKLPGPLVKWFNDTIGGKGYAELVKRMGENRAKAKTIIGYAKNPKSILFFEGNLNGKVVEPRGKYNFGYDPIFVPVGKRETLSQAKAKGDFESSPRGIAILRLKKYLLKNIR